jgi:hypothetical protein
VARPLRQPKDEADAVLLRRSRLVDGAVDGEGDFPIAEG